MQIKIKLDEGAKAPKREHATDAGADLFSNEKENVIIPKGEWRNIHTGVHIQLDGNHFGLLASKSGPNIKHGITCRGIIDRGYTGEIIAALQNIGDDYIVKPGDKVTQLIIIPCEFADFVQVDSIEGGERGDNGFGSTGLK